MTDPHYAELKRILQRSGLHGVDVDRALHCAEEYGQAFASSTLRECAAELRATACPADVEELIRHWESQP